MAGSTRRFCAAVGLDELHDLLERECLRQQLQDLQDAVAPVAQAVGIRTRALHDRRKRLGIKQGELR